MATHVVAKTVKDRVSSSQTFYQTWVKSNNPRLKG